jgi:hypothetical protein
MSTFSQVGIGTTTPNALLDIAATSTAAPITTDGFLVPRVLAFPTPVGIAQNGMMVFLTTAFGGNKVGLYYYDFPSLTWKWMTTGNNANVWAYNNANTRIEIPYQSDALTIRPLGNEVVVLDNGNVGFGTTNPARHVQVTRDINAGTKFSVSNPNTGTGAFSQITTEANGATGYFYSINSNYLTPVGGERFTAANTLLDGTGTGGLSLAASHSNGFMRFWTGGNNERMRILDNGKIGVGTITPDAQLHAVNDTDPSIMAGKADGTSGGFYLGNKSHGMIRGFSDFNLNDLTLYTGSGDINFATTQSPFGLPTLSKVGMTLKNNGLVGIGTTTPQSALSIVGSNATDQIVVAQNSNANGISGFVAKNDVGNNFLTVGVTNSASTLTGSYGSINEGLVRSSITANGLTLATANGYMRFITAQNERMRILANGTVGIATSMPTSTLDITAINPTGITTNVDGLLIPRVTRQRAQSMTGVPTSTQIYITEATTGTASGTTQDVDKAGFYYFNTRWRKLNETEFWSLSGNGGTTAGTNFLGTTNTQDLVFKTNSIENMRILNSNGNIGIGTTNPLSPIHISGASASILLERFGNGAHFVARSANGTQASPTALIANNIAGRISGWGYNGTTYSPVAYIDMMAEEAQTATAAGGYLSFTTTNAGGLSSSEKMRITSVGNVGIGTTSTIAYSNSSFPFTQKVLINSDISQETLMLTNNNVSGPNLNFGTLNTANNNLRVAAIQAYPNSRTAGSESGNLAFYTKSAAGTNVTEKMRITDVGNVGIGTANPNAKLDVNGSFYLNRPATMVDPGSTFAPITGTNNVKFVPSDFGVANGAYINFMFPSNSAFRIAGDFDGNVRTSGTTFRDIQFGTITDPFLTVKATNGFVGIGTTTPSSYQHGGTNKVLEITNSNTGLNDQSHLILSSGTSTIPYSSVGSVTWALPNATATNKGVAFMTVQTGALSTAANPSSRFVFATRDISDSNWVQDRMVIAENGNVGISTTNPVEKLTVENGNVQVGENIGATAFGRKLFFGNDFNNSDSFYFQRENISSNKSNLNLVLGDDYANPATSMTDKFNILGTNSPNTLLTIDSGSTNVGIGTASPTKKLEVVGTIKATDINFTGLLIYANEAAAIAGGILTTGDMYKTATGELRIKL